MAWSYNEETGIYSVSFSELPDLLNTLEQNTRDTPYKLDVTGVTADDLGSSGTTGTFGYYIRNTSLFIDLSPTTLPALSFMTESFSYCATLVKAPDVAGAYMRYTFFRSGIEVTPTITCTSEIFQSLEGCFAECTHLKHAIAPASLSSYGDSFFHTFHGCTALEDITFTKTPDTSSGSDGVLADCTSLRLISVSNSSMQTSMKNFLTSQQTNNSFPSAINVNSVVLLTTYDVVTDTYTVPFSELATLLNNFPQNTVDTPYKLNVTGLVASNINSSGTSGTFGNIIKENLTKYVDLSNTVLPSVTDVSYAFSACTNIILAPQVTSGTRGLQNWFSNCTNLKVTPELPNTILSMRNAFEYCSNLETITNIPTSVTYMESCFRSCEKIHYSPSIPASVRNMSNCFAYADLYETPVMASGVTDLTSCFSHNENLTKANTIPTSVTNMSSCFNQCTSLAIVENIPRQTTRIDYCFFGCSALERINLWDYNSISTGDTYSKGCFTDCDSLAHIYVNGYNSGSRNNLVTFLNNRKTNGYFPSDITPADIVFYGYTEGYSIAFSNLNNYLMYLEPNTVDNPYKLNVTGLSVANVNTSSTSGSLGYVIAHNTKYLDLSLTSLHANQTTMKERFMGCDYLVVPPNIPNNVTDMESCFQQCHYLTTMPTLSTKTTNMKNCFDFCDYLLEFTDIPEGVTDMTDCFNNSSISEPPIIPSTVTTLKGCFENCHSLAEPPVIPYGVTDLQDCFRASGLFEVPVIPSSVTNMNGTFEGTGITVAPVIPDSVTDLDSCFKDCTSLVDVPSLPSLASQLDDLSSAFDGCSSLKRVNFNGTFDLTLADFDSAFNDCDMLESVFVKSRENQVALITYLESQQNDGKFPSGLNVSEIVKFGEKIMKVQTEEGTEIVDLYRFKGQLLTEKNGKLVYADEDFKPFSVQIDNEEFFAQTIPESLLATCRNKGSGTVLKKMVGTEIVEGVTTPVYQWFTKSAGTIEEPFKKNNTTILSDISTETLDITFPKNLFPKGGRMLVCGAAGANVIDTATQNHVNYGGKGEIMAVEIPANPKEDLHILGVTFPKTSTDGETKSTSQGYCSGGTDSYGHCKGWSYRTVSGVAGGIGGNNCVVTYEKKGVSYTVTAYGGGGGGGGKAYGDDTTDYGNGGLSGDGNANVGSNGGNPYDIENCNVNELTTAFLRVEAYI